MKNLKLIIGLFVVTAFIFSCNPKEKKPDSVKVEKKELSFDALSALIGKDNAFRVFDSSGKTESDPTARVARKPKANAVVITWFNDITLTKVGSDLTYTTSPNAYIGGVTRFVSMDTNDGALGIWSCNRWWYGAPEPSVTCSDSGTGFYRAFTTDRNYDVHVSNVVNL